MPVRLLAALVAFTFVPFAFAEDKKKVEENPYKKVKVGDYTTYKVTMKVAGTALEGTMTQSVSAKSEKEVTVKVTGTIGGMDIPATEQKIDLTKPFDPLTSTLPANTEVKAEKLKDGKEKLKVGGKEYETTWETYNVKSKQNGVEVDAQVKVWQSKDLALQVAKVEMTAEIAGMKMEMELELSETGSKAD